ncbi:TPA: hypothetical protein N0F65_007838 [Lagenidium giganteum]|uniref:Uncharacterized protein n=1 Tax=Lagenidium giganteum TaxID=4803 RepID=A0AAV2Z4C9_9STRA|nr:TPA: hypothetical protein N0F65_007838 [Lagenidium giganteum]
MARIAKSALFARALANAVTRNGAQQTRLMATHGAVVQAARLERVRASAPQQQQVSMMTVAAAAASWAALWTLNAQSDAAAAHCEDASQAPQSGYTVNPIQNVTALLRLYDDIDKNMEVLTNRMLETLQSKVEEERKQNNGELKLSPEQRALSMSIEFETTLERVQDAVFRNNYVTKEHVQEAMERMVRGELPGGGKNGKITVAEADAIETYVRRLARMRWKCTGSREPLIPHGSKPIVKADKPGMPVEIVVSVMEELIPSLTREMEQIVAEVRSRDPALSLQDQQREISAHYLRRSGELTDAICQRFKVDVREFQRALVYFHDDAQFEAALDRLSKEQQAKFAELGL